VTVTTTLDRQYFNGDGANTVFPFNVRFFSNDQIYVSLIAPDGTLTPQTLTTHYTLTGAGQANGGTVTMLVPPPLTVPATRLFVQRILAQTQTTSIRNQGRFFPEVHENVFDRLTMLIQQALSSLSNALQLTFGQIGWDFRGYKGFNLGAPTNPTDAATKGYVDTSSAGNNAYTDQAMTHAVRAGEVISPLAPAASRANKLLAFDGFGNPVAVNPSSAPVGNAASVSWVRGLIIDSIVSVQQALDGAAVNIWEFAGLVVSRPNPADPTTWNWSPALAAGLAGWGSVDVSRGIFGFDADVAGPAGSKITGDGALIFRAGRILYSGVSGFSISGVSAISLVGEAIRVANCTGFELARIRSDGSHKQCGLISGSSGFRIVDCTVKNVGMTGTIVPTSEGNAFYLTGCHDFVATGNDISRTRGNGALFMWNCYEYTLADNDIYDTWFRAIDAEGTAATASPLNCIFENNRIKRTGSISTDSSAVGRNGIFAIGVGTSGRQLNDYIYRDNDIELAGENGLEGHGTFIENTVNGTGAYGGTSPSMEGIYASDMSLLIGNIVSNAMTAGIKFPGEAAGNIWAFHNKVFNPGTNGFDSNYTLGGSLRVSNFVMRGNHVQTKSGGGTRPYLIFDSSGTRTFNGSCEFDGNTSNVEELQSAVHAGLSPAGTAAPTLGGWKHGMTRRNSAITSGQPIDWRCIRSGQFTAVSFDGTSAGNSNTLTAVTNIATLRVGDIVKSAGGTTPYTITDIDTTLSTVEVIPNFGSAGTFSFTNIDPVFAALGTMP
jgi:hypothetical protein